MDWKRLFSNNNQINHNMDKQYAFMKEYKGIPKYSSLKNGRVEYGHKKVFAPTPELIEELVKKGILCEVEDCTPTWESLTLIITRGLRMDLDSEGFKNAERSLKQMAMAADKYIALCQEKQGA
jgi:hypothetical protein